jgi:signal transduction histidine kinase
LLFVLARFEPSGTLKSTLLATWDVDRKPTPEVIQSTFTEHLQDLRASVRNLSARLAVLDPIDSLQRWNELLNARVSYPRGSAAVTFELIDSLGRILAWSGNEAIESSDSLIRKQLVQRAVFCTKGHRTYVALGEPVYARSQLIVGSLMLQTHSPLETKLFSRAGIFDNVEGMRLMDPVPSPTTRLTLSDENFQLFDEKGNQFCIVSRGAGNVQDTARESDSFVEALAALCLGISLFLGLRFAMSLHLPKENDWKNYLVLLVLIWVVRSLWLYLHFPHALFGSSKLFDASYFATASGGRFTSSIGDLLITVLCFGASANIIARRSAGLLLPKGRHKFKAVSIALLTISSLAFLFLLRAYGASVRSLVLDSNIGFYRPASILPTLPVGILIVSAIVLTWGTLQLAVLLLRSIRNYFQNVFELESQLSREICFVALVTAALGLFRVFDGTPAFPLLELILFVLGIVVLERLDFPNARWRILFIQFALCVFVPWRIVDLNIHEKDERIVVSIAESESSSADALLGIVLGQATEYSLRELDPKTVGVRLADRKPSAFDVWAKSNLSKTNYRSALILFDREGRELDRFALGIPVIAQREILRRLPGTEEEHPQSLSLRVNDQQQEFWFAWRSSHDSSNVVLGGVAVIAARSGGDFLQTRLFRKVPSELSPLNVDVYRSRYERGTLLASEMRGRGPALPRALVDAESKSSLGLVSWVEESIDGKKFRSTIRRMLGSEGSFVVLTIPELAWQWHVFNLSKWLGMAALLAACTFLLTSTTHASRERRYALSFQAKLSLFFSLVVAAPFLILLSLNRQMLLDRNESRLVDDLDRNLKTVERKIYQFVESPEDFRLGISNEFCEAIANETGVDFSVYREGTIQASSRWDLFSASILERRLPEEVLSKMILGDEERFSRRERIANEEYRVGYAPIMVNNLRVGILAIPALYQQQQIDSETTESNAFLVAIYSVVLLVTVGIVVYVSRRISRPVEELTRAISAVALGNLDTHVSVVSKDEFKKVADAFNEMTVQLRESKKEIARREREGAWREMAKQVAHEIKNPLTPMKLSVQHLVKTFRDKASDREDVLHQIASTILTQIETLARIATEFSTFARFPERKFERVNLTQILQETIQLFSNIPGIEIRTKFIDHGVAIVVDKDEIQRSFVNLLRNGVQAIGERGILTIKGRLLSGSYVIEFSDTGSGIPSDLQERIFQPNFSTKSEGMGLGLAIVRQTIEDLGGTISFTSEAGKGTTFIVRLPIKA